MVVVLRPLLRFGSSRPIRLFHSSVPNLIQDPYKALGVDHSASASDIKKKYYQLAKKYHPDVNKEPDAQKKFQDIQESYDILSDASKRRQYDQFGAAAFEQGAGPSDGGGFHSNPFAGFSGFGGFGGFDAGGATFNDFFKSFTGGAQSRTSQSAQVFRGDDLETVVNITLEEAASGVAKTVKYSVLDQCNTCNGSGLKPGKHTETCGACHGSGTTVHLMQGGFQMASTCASCGGSGVIIPRSSRCGTCHGEGTVQTPKSYTLDIPIGAAEGMRMRVTGEGDSPEVRKSEGVYTQKGNLYVRINVLSHSLFERVQNNLIYTAKIPMTTAALGGKVQIPTLSGTKLQINVPAATQSGNVITIPNQGMPSLGGTTTGDLRVKLEVETLRPTDATQTILLEALADALGDKQARRQFPPLHEVKDIDTPKEGEKHEGLLKQLFNKILKHKK